MARSLAISAEQMFPRAQSARPIVYWFFTLRSCWMELVTSMRISCFSSSRAMRPRYPIRFSAKLGRAMSLRHSIWPKCVGYPSMWRYMSLAMFLCLNSTSSFLKDARRKADSLATTSRSSAAVLHSRTFRINSLFVVLKRVFFRGSEAERECVSLERNSGRAAPRQHSAKRRRNRKTKVKEPSQSFGPLLFCRVRGERGWVRERERERKDERASARSPQT